MFGKKKAKVILYVTQPKGADYIDIDIRCQAGSDMDLVKMISDILEK